MHSQRDFWITVVRSSEVTLQYLERSFLCFHLVSGIASVVFLVVYYLFFLIVFVTVVRSRDSSLAIATKLRTALK